MNSTSAVMEQSTAVPVGTITRPLGLDVVTEQPAGFRFEANPTVIHVDKPYLPNDGVPGVAGLVFTLAATVVLGMVCMALLSVGGIVVAQALRHAHTSSGWSSGMVLREIRSRLS